MYYKKIKELPKDFLWGASSSAYQVEGAYLDDGKGLSIIDTASHSGDYQLFEKASNHYYQYQEDIKLFKELGLKAYRFSIAYSRIMPKGFGEVNEAGLKFYENLVKELINADIKPIITLYHFDLPDALLDIGGWNNSQVIDYYVEYTKVVIDHFAAYCDYFITINEQNTMILFPKAVGIPRTGLPSTKELYQQSHHMNIAQAKTMIYAHHNYPLLKIGPALNMTSMYQASSKPEDAIAAHNFEVLRCYGFSDIIIKGEYHPLLKAYLNEHDLMPVIKDEDLLIIKQGKPDFIAINYYSTINIEASTNSSADIMARAGDQQIMLGEIGVYKPKDNEYVSYTPYGWVIDPVGFRLTLRKVFERYDLPILVTENGYGAKDTLIDNKVNDEARIAFLNDHLMQLKLAYQDGVDIIGYCPWSAIDVVSTHQGYEKRYGLIYVDYLNNFKRICKQSYYWYQHTILENGNNLE